MNVHIDTACSIFDVIGLCFAALCTIFGFIMTALYVELWIILTLFCQLQSYLRYTIFMFLVGIIDRLLFSSIVESPIFNS